MLQTSVMIRGGPLPPPTPGHHRPVLNICTFAINRLSVRGKPLSTIKICDIPCHHKHRDSTSSCVEDRAAAGKVRQLQIRGRLRYCTPHSVVLILCKAVIFPREIVGCLHRWRHAWTQSWWSSSNASSMGSRLNASQVSYGSWLAASAALRYCLPFALLLRSRLCISSAEGCISSATR